MRRSRVRFSEAAPGKALVRRAFRSCQGRREPDCRQRRQQPSPHAEDDVAQALLGVLGDSRTTWVYTSYGPLIHGPCPLPRYTRVHPVARPQPSDELVDAVSRQAGDLDGGLPPTAPAVAYWTTILIVLCLFFPLTETALTLQVPGIRRPRPCAL